MTRNWLRFLVPRDWTPEQAVAAAGVLRQALDAVWDVHGEEMAALLGDRATAWRLRNDGPDDDDDEIPF